ncbi:HAD family hydrolase [Neisseria animalis]|uniref:HAD family hydrolase n=2 Tax=Neisseria animalis TaxID=492 RepID=A0A5P3MWA9_NEIAN|nr:HAD family hydrolase [Neisseria animalis]ROW32908.1 HAD family hydrolase [Neisseria animalis]
MIKPSESVVVFDLDDTLYAEYDYKLSGIRAVCTLIAETHPQFDAESLAASIRADRNNWLDELCRLCRLNHHEQQSLLWAYRLHRPNIRPYLPADEFVRLTAPFAARALISDGRSISQRLKLAALGLSAVFEHILISEAEGSEKPQPERFDFIRRHYPHCRWIYIGDNIKKDFVTPNRQGWLTIGIRPQPHHIHLCHPSDAPPDHLPQLWINSLSELPDLLNRETSC